MRGCRAFNHYMLEECGTEPPYVQDRQGTKLALVESCKELDRLMPKVPVNDFEVSKQDQALEFERFPYLLLSLILLIDARLYCLC